MHSKVKKGIKANHNDFIVIPDVFQDRGDRYILTMGKDPSKYVRGLVLHLPKVLNAAMGYFYIMASDEVHKFICQNIRISFRK